MVRYHRRDKNTDKIIKGIEECGFTYIDTADVANGFPDLIAVKKIKGKWCAVLIEVKGIYGKLTDSQKNFQEKYVGLANICRTKEDTKHLLRSYERIFNA